MTGSETSAGAPATAEPRTVTDEGNAAPEAPIPFRQFLEAIHPSVERNVSGLWHESTSSLGGSKPECLRRTYISTASGVMACACPELKAILANCPKAQAFSIYDRCRVRYERY